MAAVLTTTTHFYPRPPRGGRRFGRVSRMSKFNFYPRPPRGGRLGRSLRFHRPHTISIHALREEGDSQKAPTRISTSVFLSTPSARRATVFSGVDSPEKIISIHALREEGDCINSVLDSGILKFLSTPSARRATFRNTQYPIIHSHFYPRPPRGGRLSPCPCEQER